MTADDTTANKTKQKKSFPREERMFLAFFFCAVHHITYTLRYNIVLYYICIRERKVVNNQSIFNFYYPLQNELKRKKSPFWQDLFASKAKINVF